MWSKSQGVQTLEWKHGTIILSDPILPIPANSSTFLITTAPFQDSNSLFVHSSEEQKNLLSVERLCEQMLSRGVNRQSTVYIRGGGMLLDMAGFACSIYMRGVKKVVYVPTTLLAIVDATVGGKNGVNWGGAKNLLGVVKHPETIQICLNYLKSLSDRDMCNGLSEVIKMAITHDEELFRILESNFFSALKGNTQLLKEVVKRSVSIKVKAVEADQFDHSSRKWLNFGHTVGHALELSHAGNQLKHGESVAVGMIKELELGLKFGCISNQGLIPRIKKVLQLYNLPIDFPPSTDSSQLISLIARDKKQSQPGKIELPLIDQIGQCKQSTSPLKIQQLQQFFNRSISVGCLLSQTQLSSQISQAVVSWNDRFPGSKSLAIRNLYSAALFMLTIGRSVTVNNFLSSEDTDCLKYSLEALGFSFEQNRDEKWVRVSGYNKKSSGKLWVGNSGLTVRFLLPLCAYLQGEWHIQCLPRMSERPNSQIIEYCLSNFQCEFKWLNGENRLPAVMKTHIPQQTKSMTYELKSSETSQYISSLIINSLLFQSSTTIKTYAGTLVSQSYIKMTMSCVRPFGVKAELINFQDRNQIRVNSQELNRSLSQVRVEKDLSSLTYPYALSLLHDSQLPQLPLESTQGDLKFYQYCEQLKNPQKLAGKLEFDFNECTDSFMTMAVLIASGKFNLQAAVRITGIANQRFKQSDRISMVCRNLLKIGLYVIELQDGLEFPPTHIVGGEVSDPVIFQTAGDHRLAMSLAVLASYLHVKNPRVNYVIDNKDAVNKTFPDFWRFLNDAGISLQSQHSDKQVSEMRMHRPTRTYDRKVVIVGNRGSGKTTIANSMAYKLGYHKADLDDQLTKTIRQEYRLQSIAELVDNHGWDKMRELEGREFENCLAQHSFKNIIISCGGGIVEGPQSNRLLQKIRQVHRVLYIEKDINDLMYQLDDHRPPLPDFASRSKVRQKQYEHLSTDIITLPKIDKQQQAAYLQEEFRRMFCNTLLSHLEGEILCLPYLEQDGSIVTFQSSQTDLAGIEIRADLILNSLKSSYPDAMRQLRKLISGFKIKNFDLLKSKPIILTLRTVAEYGLFDGNYQETMKNICKIPTDFLDHESEHSFSFLYDHRKVVHSYHGHNQHSINNLLAKQKGYRKLCYDGREGLKEHWKTQADIVYDLLNPMSRVHNKLRMAIRQSDKSGLINIPTRSEYRTLARLGSFIRK